MYAGLSASLLLTLNPAIQYTAFEQLRQRALKGLSVGKRKAVTELPVFEAIVIAAISKLVSTLVTYPLVRAKVLQKATPDAASLSLLEIMAEI